MYGSQRFAQRRNNKTSRQKLFLLYFKPKVIARKMGDSWEDEDFEVPTFAPVSGLKDNWEDEIDEAQVLH